MSSIIQSLPKTIITSLFLLIVIISIAGHPMDYGLTWLFFIIRWLHVVSAVMWVGLLWYFNFVQIPSMSKIPDEQKPAITKVIAPEALFWFRYAAIATVLTGLLVALSNGYLLEALSLKLPFVAIGIGMWIALLMAYNVWFILWPNQKKALGIVEVPAEEKTRAAKYAMITSRVNAVLSLPMLYLMTAQSHGGI
jgi:uncharacterized membrane protein